MSHRDRRSPPSVLATAKADATQLANAQKFESELAVIQAHPALFAKLATYNYPAKIPAALPGPAIRAAGAAPGHRHPDHDRGQPGGHQRRDRRGGRRCSPSPRMRRTCRPSLPYSAELTTMAPYSAQLTALSKVPPGVFAYLNAHGAAVAKAAAQTAGQWKTWYWICFGGIIFFMLSIPLLPRPVAAARRPAGTKPSTRPRCRPRLAKLSATV